MDEREITAIRQLDLGGLRDQLATQFLGTGSRLLFFPTIDSTNTQAMQMALQGSEEGVVVLTDSQTAGKGRLGRRWLDNSGCNALSSTILRPLFPPYLLVIIASLAVVEAIAETCSVKATIKWPNDVLIEDRKVAGILIETSHDRNGQLVAIVGIGVNVNEAITLEQTLEPRQSSVGLLPTAITLEEACGQVVSREIFLAHLLQHLENMYLALQQEAQEAQKPTASSYGAASRLLQEQWRNQLSTLGRTIQVQQGDRILSGVAEDVNAGGELLLRQHSGELISVTWGDVGYPTK